jgi:dTDP-4-dehydrorhamnose 3,5-epimerase
VVLSGQAHQAVYIPPGFAHGFCVLSAEAEVFYKVTQEYAPELDAGIRWDDPDLAIPWPVSAPIVSARDAVLPRLREAVEVRAEGAVPGGGAGAAGRGQP